jgi:DNA modification methylase
METKLNDLDAKEWIKFQKSWFVHNPPPRKKDHYDHPAKYPETLAEEFIRFFTKEGDTVFDPMVGTGSTLLACLRAGRRGIGLELNAEFVDVAARAIKEEAARLGLYPEEVGVKIIEGDARDTKRLVKEEMDYCITSPPYWDMFHMKGAQTQRGRKEAGLKVVYSENGRDLGNIHNYGAFVSELVRIYREIYDILKDRRYFTVIVKNVKKGGRIYPLA